MKFVSSTGVVHGVIPVPVQKNEQNYKKIFSKRTISSELWIFTFIRRESNRHKYFILTYKDCDKDCI
jgi:hypothetical protein